MTVPQCATRWDRSGPEPAPDETTICKFRHLIEAQGLGKKLFAAVNEHLSAKGIKIGKGTIMDATIIAAPSSTKNADGKRDPEMHQTKKGNQWYFGMKAYIGVDSKVKTVHSVTATPANVNDSLTIGLLHGDETRVWGDSAYQGQREAIIKAAPQAQDFTHHRGNRVQPQQGGGRQKPHQIARPRSRRASLPYSNAFSDSVKSAIALSPRTSTVCRSASRSSICL